MIAQLPQRLNGRRLPGRLAAEQFELPLAQAGPGRAQRLKLVAKVVEAQFIAGSVGHVAGVSRPLGRTPLAPREGIPLAEREEYGPASGTSPTLVPSSCRIGPTRSKSRWAR